VRRALHVLFRNQSHPGESIYLFCAWPVSCLDSLTGAFSSFSTPMRRHFDRVDANLREVEAFSSEKEILTLLKRTGVPLQLVNLFNCNVWHDVFGKSFDLWVRVMSPNNKEISHGRVSVQTR
jgi:hypothetical protein